MIPMLFKENTSFLMLKINTPPNIDFLAEHKDIIKRTGDVWFCRFGKANIITSKITQHRNIIFLKDSKQNNERVYMGTISKISWDFPSENYPLYYNKLNLKPSLWFCFTDIKEVNPNLILNNFRTTSSNASLTGIYRSMCNSFYIKCICSVDL